MLSRIPLGLLHNEGLVLFVSQSTVNSIQKFSFVKYTNKKEIEMIFLCLCVTLLKKVNRTQKYSFVKDTNKKRNWNTVFVCYSFEKCKQYTEIFLCKRHQQGKNLKDIFVFVSYCFEKDKQYTKIFLRKNKQQGKKLKQHFCICPSLLKKVNSTQRFSCVHFTFFKWEQEEKKFE